MRWLAAVVPGWLAACAATPPANDVPGPALAVPHDTERHYAIWLGGAQVGTAEEREQWSAAGVFVRRTEAMRFLRGDAPVAITTTIEITADARLVASHVTWTEAAQATRHGDAVRDAAGWRIADDDGARRLPAAAIPAELAPLLVRRDGRFAGLVFLPARGFVAGRGRIDAVAPRRLVARLALPDPSAAASTGASPAAATPGAIPAPTAGAGDADVPATDPGVTASAEATIDLGDDGMPVRVVDGEGVIATRITADEAAAPFTPVDLIAATSIPLGEPPASRVPGARTSVDHRHLVLEGDVVLPALPGQAAHATADGVALELSARLRGGLPPGPAGPDRTREIITLVADVHRRIAPDLAAHPSSARTATSGDCTTFALAYAALAGDRAIPTRVVTGFRVDGDRLIRHRWAISWTGRAWIAVDAAFGAVPAGGDLVGLAVHDAGDVGLVAGEAALTHLRAASWR